MLRPARALSHPAWWLALALLLANDHLFKGAGVLPPALTGKLSDFAGLLVAPALLATLAGVRRRRGWWGAHLAVAAGFAAINVSPAFARAWEAALAWTPLPWAITVDPGDLIALPMVAVSAVVFGRWAARPAPVAQAARVLGLGLGGLACAATSPPPESYLPPTPAMPTTSARLMVANRSAITAVIRVRSTLPGVGVDCPWAAGDPEHLLSRDLFGPAQTWLLEGGRALPLGVPDSACGLYLVDGPDLPARLVLAGEYPVTTLSTSASQLPAARGLFFDAVVGGFDWAGHPDLRVPAVDPPEAPAGRCAPVPEGFGVTWSTPPLGTAVLLDHSVAADGCHAFDLAFRDTVERWVACFPALDLPFAVEDTLRVTAVTTGASGQPVDGVEVAGPGGRLVLTRGQDLPALGLSEVAVAQACDHGAADACGGYQVALSPAFRGPDGEPVQPGVGEAVVMGDVELVIARAVLARAIAPDCAPDQPLATPWFEAAAVAGH
ncbi:MAG: hypothetical protein R3F60_21040 [bacterium]